MDTAAAGWFVDPLGRFSGRFFDGERWTDQVSDQGVLRVDHDWCPTSYAANVVDTQVSETASAASGVAGSYTYTPVIPAVVATHSGGRNDRRQVQIPVAVERRKNNHQATSPAREPQHA